MQDFSKYYFYSSLLVGGASVVTGCVHEETKTINSIQKLRVGRTISVMWRKNILKVIMLEIVYLNKKVIY